MKFNYTPEQEKIANQLIKLEKECIRQILSR